jgi:thioredoxin
MDFNAETALGDVLVDFSATWCGPCRMMAEIIASDVRPAKSDLKVLAIDVDREPELAARFGVTSIPALFCFRDGREIARFSGVTDAREILDAFRSR